jgi:CRP/FNR family transcriptional regulator
MVYERPLILAYLSQVPMFRSCSQEQLDHLVEMSTPVEAVDGHEIIREGDPSDAFYVLMTGKTRVTRGGRTVAELSAGEYFGELGLFDPAPRSATVTAIGPVGLLSLTRDDFRRALDEMPSIRDALLHGMAHLIHELNASA